MVGADAHSPAQLLALEHKRLEALLDGYEVLVKLFLQDTGTNVQRSTRKWESPPGGVRMSDFGIPILPAVKG